MATQTRPFMTTGAALLSAAAIAAAVPAVAPGHLAGVPTPLSLAQAQYELTALSDVSVEGVLSAFIDGWGGFIGADDPYYPGVYANDITLNGFFGAAYYVADQALDGLVPFNLENYFFEVGSQGSNLLTSGLGAAAYVGASGVFGVDSLPAQLIKTFVGGGGASIDIGQAIIALTADLPVIGDLTQVYFTGQIEGDTAVYGTGIIGVVSYAVQKLLPGIISGGGISLPGLGIAGVLAGVATLVGGLINGGGWGGSDDEDDDEDSYRSAGHSDDEDDDDDHHGKSVAAPAAAVSAKSVAGDSEDSATDARESVEADDSDAAGSESGEAGEAAGDSKDEATEVTSEAAAPKRGAVRAAAAQGAKKADSAGRGAAKRAKAGAAS